MKECTELEKSIIKTVSYFSLFQYPLTLLEVYKWLFEPDREYGLTEILAALDSLVDKGVLEKKFGFYFLLGQTGTVQTRLERYRLAERKFKIALFVARRLYKLGYVRNISICNNAGYNNAQPGSDIDFFIIVCAGRLWLSRLLITLITSALGRRRHAKKIANRACLSFYLADDNYDLSGIALDQPDIYLIYWLATLAPVFDRDCFEQFIRANCWQKKYLPNYYPAYLSGRRSLRIRRRFNPLERLKNRLKPFFGANWLEGLARAFQRQKMKGHLHSQLVGTEVVITDSMLKFHENDRRREYFNAWQALIKEKIN